jgi:hypothetical protein
MSMSESTPRADDSHNVASAESANSLSQQFFDLAQSLRIQARELRARTPAGVPNLEADALDAQAAKFEDKTLDIATQSEINRGRVIFEKWLKEQEHFLAWRLENTRSIISLSQSAIRVIATANAGAAVALLAFLGNALAKDARLVAEYFAPSLLTFAMGVVVAVLVAGSSYVTQLLYGVDDPKKQKLAKRLHWLTVALWLTATGAFAVGCFETYSAVRSMTRNESAPMATKYTDRGSVELVKKNEPAPARPASDPPVVQMPGPKPVAPAPAPKQ